VFFDAVAYGHRLQSRLRKLNADGKNQLEFGAEAVLDEVRISDSARCTNGFSAPREESDIDGHTRALWHFENESDNDGNPALASE
jgi:hypothetical protein